MLLSADLGETTGISQNANNLKKLTGLEGRAEVGQGAAAAQTSGACSGLWLSPAVRKQVADDKSQGCQLQRLTGDITAGEGASGARRGPQRSVLVAELDIMALHIFSLFSFFPLKSDSNFS